MMNHIAWISFTPRGRALAEKLCEAMGGTAEDARREGFSLSDWTERAFSEAQALVFVGAAGICVRAIAPFLTVWMRPGSLSFRFCRAISAGRMTLRGK